jgi:regulatory protein
MGTITALIVQKRNQERVNVYLDDQFAFGLAIDIAARLKVGQTLTPEQIAELQQQDLSEKARQSAIRFITYRPRSATEVERNLRKKGFVEPVVSEVIERLQRVGLIDDLAFARYWLEQRETFKPRSQMALRLELQQKGVSRNVIEEVLAELDETAAAQQAAAKQARRWTGLPEREFRLKLGQFLQRRGFNYEIIRQVTNEMWQSLTTDTTDIDHTQ